MVHGFPPSCQVVNRREKDLQGEEPGVEETGPSQRSVDEGWSAEVLRATAENMKPKGSGPNKCSAEGPD